MTQEKVCIVLPSHNRRELLKRAVASVQSQTLSDWKLIIVNDASSDGSREWLDSLSDSRIEVIHHAQSRGAAGSRNVAIRRSQAKYVAFLDDDDYWLPEKLERQINALESSGRDWCICGFRELDRTGETDKSGEFYESQLDFSRGIGERHHNWSLIATPGWLVRRTLLEKCGYFDERIRSYDDWELGIRFHRAGARPLFLPDVLWIKDEQQGGGLVYARRDRATDLRIIVDKHGVLWEDDGRVQSRHWYLIGRTESLFDPPPAGRRELWRALKLTPWRPKIWFALLSSLAGRSLNTRLANWWAALQEMQRYRSLHKIRQGPAPCEKR